MIIGVASDHKGFELKEKIIKYLKEKNNEIINYGTDTDTSVDYPDYAFKVGEDIRDKKIEFGILICGSGIGMSIACNKVDGVRCAKINSSKEAFYTRNDNDANVMAISSKTRLFEAKGIIDNFIKTPFSNKERHINRIKKIKDYENKC